MPHKHPAPEHERPTIEELQRHNHKPVWIAMKVSGYWEQESDGLRPEFEVSISGDSVDVNEAIESLKENGNLHDLKFEKVM